MGETQKSRRRLITKERVDALRPGETIWEFGGARGFGVRRQKDGASFVFKYRFAGEQRFYTLGRHGTDLTVEQARKAVEAVRGRVAMGADPAKEKREARKRVARDKRTAFRLIARKFIARHAKPNTRTWRETKRILDRYVLPEWGERPIADIRRGDVVDLLDTVEDRSGSAMAHHVLAVVRKLFNWWASRTDDFRSPIVAGMGRIKAKERARTRTLSDAELRAVWKASATITPAVYGALIQFLILTAQRRDEASRAKRSEFQRDEWLIPAERYKTGQPHLVPLSEAARTLVESQPRFGPFLFTTNGKTPFSGFSKTKARLDTMVLAELRRLDSKAILEPWRHHDLRRTARSLMSRAGVDADHAERALGHAIPGIRATYDLHSFAREKRLAFERLAEMVQRIVNPPAENVVALKR